MKRLILFILISFMTYSDSFDFFHDNDIFITDEYYTSGFEFKYRHDSTKEENNYYNFILGQKFYTPSNITEIETDKYDRPYAAWLYLGYEKEKIENRKEKIYGFQMGITGPNALGEFLQGTMHEIIGEEIPSGWKTQIEEIIGLQYYYSLKDEVFGKEENGNFISRQNHYVLELGNIFVNGKYGKIFLIGNKTPFEKSQRELNYYFYFEPQIQLTLYDATLKGRIYDAESIVTRDFYNYVINNIVGAQVEYKDLMFAYSLNFNSTEIKEMPWKVVNHTYSKFYIRVNF